MGHAVIIVVLFISVVSGCAPSSSTTKSFESESQELSLPDGGLVGARLETIASREQLKALKGWYWVRGFALKSLSQQWGKGSQSLPLSLSESQNGTVTLTDSSSNLNLQFECENENHCELKVVNSEKIEPIHLSWHKTLPIFSILFRNNEKRLVSLYFSHSSILKFEGKMPPPRWNQREVLDIDFCGDIGNEQEIAAKKAISIWAAAMAPYFRIETKFQRKGFAPFSDLNSHCVYFDNSFKTSKFRGNIEMGHTILFYGLGDEGIVDADTFVFSEEILKMKSFEKLTHSPQRQDLLWILVHEIGHVLGFGHAPTGQKSVMSAVSEDVVKLTDFDFAQIKKMYGSH